uniref:Cystatin domain-containing protein n=1 Tax=Amblyomma maculatum TaxID=34609 RepID=G3MLQ8_AMBMU
MKVLAVLSFLAVTGVTLCYQKGGVPQAGLVRPGFDGWQDRDASRDSQYRLLATYAIQHQKKQFLATYYRVIIVLRAQMQVVNGRNYRLKFLVAPRKCRISTGPIKSELCRQKGNNALGMCNAVIHISSKKNIRTVRSFSCTKRCNTVNNRCSPPAFFPRNTQSN